MEQPQVGAVDVTPFQRGAMTHPAAQAFLRHVSRWFREIRRDWKPEPADYEAALLLLRRESAALARAVQIGLGFALHHRSSSPLPRLASAESDADAYAAIGAHRIEQAAVMLTDDEQPLQYRRWLTLANVTAVPTHGYQRLGMPRIASTTELRDPCSRFVGEGGLVGSTEAPRKPGATLATANAEIPEADRVRTWSSITDFVVSGLALASDPDAHTLKAWFKGKVSIHRESGAGVQGPGVWVQRAELAAFVGNGLPSGAAAKWKKKNPGAGSIPRSGPRSGM